MNKIGRLVTVGLIAMFFFSQTAHADARRGQRIYIKHLQRACGFNASRFAAIHTQDEWEAINESGRFVREIKRLCPNAKIRRRDIRDLYQFVYEYANDSGNIPLFLGINIGLS